MAMVGAIGRAGIEVRVVDGLTINDMSVREKRDAAHIAHEEP